MRISLAASRIALRLFALSAMLGAACAQAQTVSMSGSLGSKALLVIDGKPRQLAVGETTGGVRLVSVSGDAATVEVQGKRVALQLGGAQVNLGGTPSEGTARQIVLTSSSGGHYVTSGLVNGQSVRFVVDTGATNVSLSQAEAERIGVDLKSAQRIMVATANGAVPAYRLKLASVRVGDVQLYEVDANVIPAPMPFVLLGNSFLSHFTMHQENDRMTLDRRY